MDAAQAQPRPATPVNLYTFSIFLAAITVVGVVFRLWLMLQANLKLDYDEAMIGLMARDIAAGNWYGAFVPAQPTLGSAEAWLLAPWLQLTGTSRVAFRLYALLTAAAYILSSAWLGWACFRSHRAALVSALAASLAPAYILVAGAKTWGFTIETLILGNILIILTQLASQRTHKWAAVGAGLCAGVMFWNTWLSLYYLLPVALFWLLHPGTRRQVPLVMLTFFLGSAPFWLHNLQSNFESFGVILGENSERSAPLGIITKLRLFIEDHFTQQVTGFPAWSPAFPLLQLLAVGLYAAGCGLLGLRALQTRWPALLLTASLLVTVPLIYLLSTYSDDAMLARLYGVDATGRYVVMLHSVFPIAVAALLLLRPRLVRVIAVTAVIVLNVFIAVQMNPSRAFDSPYYQRQPDTLAPVIDLLLENNITHIWTDVGIGQPLMFYTDYQILAADYYDTASGGLARFPTAYNAVENSQQAAYVVPIIPGQTDTPLNRALDAEAITYAVHYLDSIAVYIPAEHVHPSQIADGLGAQY